MELDVKEPEQNTLRRYGAATEAKTGGVAYTPKVLADFVAHQMLSSYATGSKKHLRILDPAIGEGELLLSILEQLEGEAECAITVCGFETDESALAVAESRIAARFPNVALDFTCSSFLDYILDNHYGSHDLFHNSQETDSFDLVIANPPYVRTQILGGEQSRQLMQQFNLSGRMDLYYPFLLGISRVLAPDGVAGVIVSNRFMTTKSGASIRKVLRDEINVEHVWDLGDTKLFDVAVLPAVLLLSGKGKRESPVPQFSSIYQTKDSGDTIAANPLEALKNTGIVTVKDGRSFAVKHGALDINGSADSVWRISCTHTDQWMECVTAHTHKRFSDIGKIRVGVKTCADKVFIRSDWSELPHEEQPELLRNLITHHIAGRFKAKTTGKQKQILYPHESANGKKQAVNLAQHPKSAAYLEQHRATLESRKYVIEAGRAWYEIWVPQDPSCWDLPKLVFRDISERPTFWIDQSGGVVNGDCYWLAAQDNESLNDLWLAVGVANSSFIEAFYDHRFNNKLYAGRRRFITQYVEEFPLPYPMQETSKRIIQLSKQAYECSCLDESTRIEREIDQLVWSAFGLPVKEVRG
jgi:adenine-specific DNA-methyltransferase